MAIEIANPSGGSAGVALGLVEPGDPDAVQVIAVELLREVDRDRDDLIPAIERLFAATRRSLADVRRVAVSVGPGGFTSARVACATGAMLAEGLGVPTVAVPSALAAAVRERRTAGAAGGHVAVLMASKGAAAWCALVPTESPSPARAVSGRMMTAAEVVAAGPRVALADHHLPADIRAALDGAGIAVRPLEFSAEDCLRASALCDACDPAALVPVYPREPEAVTLWRARHGALRGNSDSGSGLGRADTPGQ
ncbi:MAG TPA: hypothetical protein VEB22_12135 [Phycisphaerales bacterium]|nr:hypothetical protein [Phycisphaerales bacterium]